MVRHVLLEVFAGIPGSLRGKVNRTPTDSEGEKEKKKIIIVVTGGTSEKGWEVLHKKNMTVPDHGMEVATTILKIAKYSLPRPTELRTRRGKEE